jgi:hypothetical protein
MRLQDRIKLMWSHEVATDAHCLDPGDVLVADDGTHLLITEVEIVCKIADGSVVAFGADDQVRIKAA